MITMETNRLVEEYLRRLDAAAAHLQRERRTELVAEIREHIDAALRQEDATSGAAVRNVLERLGAPEEIVEAAEPVPGAWRVGKLELAALVSLVLPLVGWLVGIVLVLVSRAWSSRQKLIGIALALLPPLLPLLILVSAGAESGAEELVPGEEEPVGVQEESGESLGPVEVVVAFAVFFLAGLPSALYLGTRLRR